MNGNECCGLEGIEMAEKEKLSKVEKAMQNAVIKEIMAEFGLEDVTKKRLGKYHRGQRVKAGLYFASIKGKEVR